MREEDRAGIRWSEPIPFRVEVLRSGINRFYDEGSRKWTFRDLKAVYLKLEEVLPYLKEWEKKGYIKIWNNEDCLFEVLNFIEEPIEK